MNKKRILYLLSRENVLEPGVLKSQVLNLAGKIIKKKKDTEIFVLDFPSLHKFLKYFRNYHSIMKYARGLGIKLIIIPILPIGRSIMPIWAIPFFLLQTLPFVLFFSFKYRIKIINARSHLSALLAYASKKFGADIRIVFEIHGPYLLEGVTHGRWESADFDYKFWSVIERILFAGADYIVVRSSGLLDYVSGIAPKANASIIPPSVDADSFSLSEKERKNGRMELGIDDRFAVAYSGSLGSFHRPDFLVEFYSLIRKYISSPLLLVITHSDYGALVEGFRNLGVPQNELRVVYNPPELGKILPLADASLHVYNDLPITPFVLSAKLGEYLSAGLPAIVTDNLVSTTNLIEKSQCGVVINISDSKDVRSKMQKLVRERGTLKKNSLRLARDYFSVKVCARKYLEIYDELASKNKL